MTLRIKVRATFRQPEVDGDLFNNAVFTDLLNVNQNKALLAAADAVTEHKLYQQFTFEQALLIDDDIRAYHQAYSTDVENSPMLATFPVGLNAAGEAAIIEFSTEAGSRIILDGASSTYKGFTDWTVTR